MNIGLITIHHTINFGAVFQAYGLFKYINTEFDGCCEFIDYRMNQKKLIGESEKKKSIVMVRFGQLLHIRETLANRKTRMAFEEFWKSQYRMSPKTIYGDSEVGNDDFNYDICISGSDQIFNLDLTNDSKAFFLVNAKNSKKIAYSSSFGMFGLAEQRKADVKKMLSSYSAISVREKEEAEMLSVEMNRVVLSTCDPVFLLSKDEWLSIAKPVTVPKRYILIYSMSSNPNVKMTVRWLLAREKMPVLIVKNGVYDLGVRGREIKGIGPREFLSIISNATYVVTNSFHGTAFSTIFEKPFFCLEEEKYINDARYSQLMHEGKSKDKITPYDTDWKEFDYKKHLINGELLYRTISPWISFSKEYLKNSITE